MNAILKKSEQIVSLHEQIQELDEYIEALTIVANQLLEKNTDLDIIVETMPEQKINNPIYPELIPLTAQTPKGVQKIHGYTRYYDPNKVTLGELEGANLILPNVLSIRVLDNLIRELKNEKKVITKRIEESFNYKPKIRRRTSTGRI